MRVSVPNQRYCGRMMKQGERRNLQPPIWCKHLLLLLAMVSQYVLQC
jgi:hypothetical protein